jgi:hypothetical protein
MYIFLFLDWTENTPHVLAGQILILRGNHVIPDATPARGSVHPGEASTVPPGPDSDGSSDRKKKMTEKNEGSCRHLS